MQKINFLNDAQAETAVPLQLLEVGAAEECSKTGVAAEGIEEGMHLQELHNH